MDQVNKVVLGKKDEVALITTILLAEGHILIEDVPGTGKTVLSKALAIGLGLPFRRIQMTPDLLPSDLTGGTVLNRETGTFSFREGPLFASVVLADEINRASPKTLSAMLEGMEEGSITVDGETHVLPKPYLVMATQNPVEHEGVFPLPYAQIDRFSARIELGYLPREVETKMMEDQQLGHPIEEMKPLLSKAEVDQQIAGARALYESEVIRGYIVDLVRATRTLEGVSVGASSRGALALSRAARARAWIQGRDLVLPDDVQALAVAVLGHRILDRAGSAVDGPDRVRDLLQTIRVPVP
ncbi:AAA family ATPase [bacterium]|nr:AAA family ATPase [bacterium]